MVRFTVRKAITDNVSYTASVRSGNGSWALVARRGAGVDSFLLYDLTLGRTTTVTGAIEGRTATVRAPIEALGGQTNATLGRVSAYFRAEPVAGRRGDADRAANVGPTVWFCLTDRRPRPEMGPVHLARPGSQRRALSLPAESPTARRDPARPPR